MRHKARLVMTIVVLDEKGVKVKRVVPVRHAARGDYGPGYREAAEKELRQRHSARLNADVYSDVVQRRIAKAEAKRARKRWTTARAKSSASPPQEGAEP